MTERWSDKYTYKQYKHAEIGWQVFRDQLYDKLALVTPGCYSFVSISDTPTYGDVQCIDGVTFFPEPVGLSLDLAWCLCGVIQNPETTSECINQCQERYSSEHKGLVN